MTNRRSIVMSGDLGSGKSTISLQVASRLGLRRLSMGDLYRNMAQERGMSALQLNLHAERDEAVDDYIDQLQAEIARSHEQLVIDSRLSWFFFSDAFKVYLIVDPVTAARRVMSRPANDVEAYSSVEEAVDRLRSRSNSERIRFIRKYAVDKTRLRNYDMVCDTTRAGPDEIADRIVAAFNGTFGQEILAHSPPLLLLDPARIYPSQDINGRPGPWDPGSASGVRQEGRGELAPISIAYTGQCFYVVDGHRRLSIALQNKLALVAGRLVAEADEQVIAGLSAQQYFAAEVGLSAIHDWAAAHKIALPLPPHLKALEVPEIQRGSSEPWSR
jgi:cytidylate kinase